MSYNLLNMRLDLFDGGSAGAGSGGGASAAAGAGEGTNSGVTSSNGTSAEASPVSRRRSNAGVYDNVKFGKQPTAEGAGAGEGVIASDAGKDGDGTVQGANDTGDDVKKTDAPKTREERRRAYDEFIKGEGKEFYAEDTQRIVSKRVNDLKAMEDRMGKLQPFMEALADKYGLPVDDLEGLMKAIQGDRDFFSEAAAEAGMDNPETYRQFREAQRRSQALEAQQKAQLEAAEAARRQSFVAQKMQAWQTEAEGVKAKYPGFNFEADSANPQFMSMLRAGVSIEAAYRALHHDEIVAGAVDNARAQTEKSVVENIRAKGSRPAENGTSGASTFTYKSDVSKLSKADRAEIARRAARGEKIVF